MNGNSPENRFPPPAGIGGGAIPARESIKGAPGSTEGAPGQSAPEPSFPSREQVLEALKPVVDPEIRLSIVDLGLVYGVDFQDQGRSLVVRMTLTSPMCPYGPMLLGQVQDVINCFPGVEQAKVELVWEPPWDPRTMASDEAKDMLKIW